MSYGGDLAADPIRGRPEPLGDRTRRHTRRAGLYGSIVAAVALVVLLIALVASNTRKVELDWIVGSGQASLVWIIVVSAVVGWVTGILTAVAVRRRTRFRE